MIVFVCRIMWRKDGGRWGKVLNKMTVKGTQMVEKTRRSTLRV
jgi:hypothetical protein